ncbi:hypothetical protein JW890_03695 [candidate division WOR-3 bacterium]|nr:hypothetical protein [candidate division WOR-3 bacterium]
MHSILFVSIFILSWAPSGDFEGGQLSHSGNQTALIKNGELGILAVSSGDWSLIDLPGTALPPVKWSGNSQFLAVGLKIDGDFFTAVIRISDGSYMLTEKSGPIRSISWNNTDELIAVSSQNNSSPVPCTTYVYQLNQTDQTLKALLIFPARDPYFLSDGNIVCLAGNHLPSVRAGNRKPYSYTAGYAFVIKLDGTLASKIELFDDPSLWEVDFDGTCVYASGNKIYYVEISSSGKMRETLLSLQNGLIGNNLISAVDVRLSRNYIYCLWEIGSIKMLGSYIYSDQSSEKIIITDLSSFSTVFSNENVCVLSGGARKGIYTPQGKLILSFSGEPLGYEEEGIQEISGAFSIRIECPNLPDLFSTIKKIDESFFSFIPSSSTPAYQIRVLRDFSSSGETVYKIHIGSFSNINDAESSLQEVETATGKTASVEQE